MKRIPALFYLFILLFVSAIAVGQDQGGISGCIARKGNGNAIGYANVAVLNTTTGGVSNGTISGNNGQFVINFLDPGVYTIQITYLGFEPTRKEDIYVDAGRITDIDTIFIHRLLNEINEIEVVGQGPLIEQGMGKTTLNVNDNMAGSGESALDLMRYIPSASTDEDDNVLIRGAPATVLIDGVETSLEQVLSSLPVETIEKMEVITNPSAKYSSRNGSAIINVVLKKGKARGANGRASAALETPERIQLGGSLILRNKAWTSFSNLNLSHAIYKTESITHRITEKSNDTTFLNNSASSPGNSNRIQLSQGLKYRIDKSSSIQADINFQYNLTGGDSYAESRLFKGDSVLKSHSLNETDRLGSGNFLSLGSTYEKEFSSLSKMKILLKHERQENLQESTRQSNSIDIVTGILEDNYSILSQSHPEVRQSTRLNAELEHNFSKHLMMESGIMLLSQNSKNSNRALRTKYVLDSIGSANIVSTDSSKSYQFTIEEASPSAYFVLTGEWGKWLFSGGLRYEYIFMDNYSITTDTGFINHFHNIMPTLQVSSNLTDKLSIGLSYSNRVQMPNHKQLNPVINYSGQYSKTGGNPDLKPERITNAELYLNWFAGKNSVSSTVFFKRFSGKINRISTIVIEEDKEITFHQYENIGNVDQFGYELSVSNKLWKVWLLKSNLMLLESNIDYAYKGEMLNISDLSYSGKLISDLTLWKNLRWQLSANYESSVNTVKGRDYSVFFVNSGIRLPVLKKKGSLFVQWTDIFNTLKHERLNETMPNFSVYTYSKGITQKLLVSFSYKFNTQNNKNN